MPPDAVAHSRASTERARGTLCFTHTFVVGSVVVIAVAVAIASQRSDAGIIREVASVVIVIVVLVIVLGGGGWGRSDALIIKVGASVVIVIVVLVIVVVAGSGVVIIISCQPPMFI